MLKNPFLTDEEQQQMLVSWNDTRLDFPTDLCIHQLFEAQAGLTPNAIAVACERTRLTYQQLNQRANQLARYLRILGIGPEVAVGIFMEHSVDIMVAMLGILKAGGVYVPLDTRLPAERLQLILADARARVVVVRSLPPAWLGVSQSRIVRLESDGSAIAELSEGNLPVLTVPANRAFLLYTSGSTGMPKGVLTTHLNLVGAYFAWEVAYQLRTLITSHGQIANVAFAVFQADWVRALCSGGKLVLCPLEVVLTPRRLYQTMVEEAIDFVEFVPGVLRSFIAYLDETHLSLAFLRTLVVGSDRWYVQEHLNLRYYCAPTTRIIHSFGLTETTIDSAYFLQTSEDLQAGHLVPIGRPFPNVLIYLLDAFLRPVPVGVPGELFIGGNGLAAGYLNHPSLTAERFIPHPFALEAGQRLYRTGDLACYLPDGNVQFLGRKDHQVKVRGFRVELGEIEVALRQHPAVSQAVVVAREDHLGESRLFAYVVPKKVPDEQTFPRYQLTADLEVACFSKVEAYYLYQKIFQQAAYFQSHFQSQTTGQNRMLTEATHHQGEYTSQTRNGQVGMHYPLPIRDGACIIDVGANIGLFTLLAHQQVQQITSYVIEPSASLFDILQANMRLHGVKAHALHCALADREAEAAFTFYPRRPELSSLLPDEVQDQQLFRQLVLARLRQHVPDLTALPASAEAQVLKSGERQVEYCAVKTLSSIISTYQLAQIDLIKISAPRRELQILQGIQATDWPKIGQLVLEIYDSHGSLNQVTKYLEERGYRVSVRQIPGFEETALFYVSTERVSSDAGGEDAQWTSETVCEAQPQSGTHSPSLPSRSAQLIALGADTPALLAEETAGLLRSLRQDRAAQLVDIARAQLQKHVTAPYRRALVCETVAQAISNLESLNTREVMSGVAEGIQPRIVFMFPGVGAQYPNMGRDLYQTEVLFRAEVDRCAQLLYPLLGVDIRDYIYPAAQQLEFARERLQKPSYAFPSLFTIEYALARQWMDWHVQPDAMIGHSLGEYTAACLAGVISLTNALALVVLRGQLLEKLPSGAMLSVPLSEQEITPLLHGQLSLAAINGPAHSVVSGPPHEIEKLKRVLTEAHIKFQPVHFGAAPHSSMVEPVLNSFASFVKTIPLHAPRIPFVSDVSGTWITEAEATDAAYWVKHLRQTVRFSDGIYEILQGPSAILLEVGPGRNLSSLVKLGTEAGRARLLLSSLRHPHDQQSDTKLFLRSLGQLWLVGVAIDWDRYLQTAQDLTGRLEYNRDLFEPATIDRLAGYFQTLVTSLFAQPDRPVREIALLTAAERHQMLVEWNKTQVSYPHDRCIHQLFAEQVERTPDAIALVFDEEQMSYRALNRHADQLAHMLQQRGVGPEVLVGLYVERSLEMAIGLLAILKTGGAYVPLDPSYPPERLSFMVQDARASVLLTQSHLRPVLSLHNTSVLYLDSPRQLFAETAPDDLTDTAVADNLAYVIYTSGSTGKPKGVALSHQALCNRIAWQLQYSPRCARTLQFSALSFDASFHEMFSTWLSGSTLILTSEETRHDSLALWQLLGKEHIERLFVPVVALQHLAEVATSEDLAKSQLQEIITAGEQLKITPAMKTLFATLSACTLRNDYGPSETHGVTAYELSGPPDAWPILPPLGYPNNNTRIYILDTLLQPVPIGVVGELYIGGVCLGRGYYERPELTAERFVPDHLSQEPGMRLYKTGDLARYLLDGVIEFLGRADQQVKLRGFRVELGEIEATLIQHPAILQVVVIVRDDEPWGKRLVAYIVTEGAVQPATDELRHFLARTLPEYMVPTVFVRLDQLQLTPSGKVDRKALPIPNQQQIAAGQNYVAPTGPVEQLITEIWMSALKLEQIGVYDNFFALGGHSLLARQVVSKINQALGTNLLLTQLLLTPTIREIAAHAGRTSAAPESQVHIPRLAPRDHYPLSFAQRIFFMLHQIAPDSTVYNVPTVLLFDGVLDTARLRHALRALIQQHEVFRTAFFMLDGVPCQRIQREVPFELREMVIEETNLNTLLPQIITPFNLTQAPLIHLTLLHLDPDRHMLLLDIHHIITDSVSGTILIQDLMSLYRDEPMQEPRIHYPDFAVWQNALLSSEHMRVHEEYWLDIFRDLPPVLNLPTDWRRTLNKSFEGAILQVPVATEVVEALRQLALSKGVTLHMLLLAIYYVLLTLYTGLEDIVVGCPVAERPHADVQDTVGVFINMLAMRNRPARAKTFDLFLNEVRDNLLQAYEHQSYPFELLVSKLPCARDTSRNPLFDTILDFSILDNRPLSLPGCTVTPYDFNIDSAKFDLSVDAVQTGKDLLLVFEYCTTLFEEVTIEQLSKHLLHIMQQVIANPSMKIGQIELEPQQVRESDLRAFNRTFISYPRHLTVNQLFEQRVEQTPDAIAIVFANEQMTYAELHAVSNRLARLLQAEGVKHGDLIPIVARRSISMIIGLLAVLKAGAGYIPVDPAYPVERVRHVLQEANAPVTLASREVITSGAYLADTHIIDLDDERVATFEDTPCAIDLHASDVAYVIYTSGTSGRPKGALISHASLVNMCFAWRQEYRMATFEVRLLQVASFAFDVFTADVMRALTGGGCLILCPQGTQVDLPRLGCLIEEQAITIFEATPALIIPLLNYAAYHDLRLDSLRVLTLGSDAFYTQDYHFIRSKLPDSVRIINSYGVTEGTVDSCYYVDGMPRGTALHSLTVPIGRPFPNIQLYVLNEALIPQPRGVVGELYISGAGVSYGYLHRPDQTASVFLPNPFVEGERMYKTGDQAHILADGNIELLGRIDEQIQLGGYRIELAEIEAQLLSLESIKEAIVVCKANTSGQKYLCAYIVASSAQSQGAIKSSLSSRLPSYMIPSSIYLLDDLPVTPNGKIDRRALQHRQDEISLDVAYNAPKNPLEARLSTIWQELLGLERVSTTASFFEMGGNSLLLLALFNRINQEIDTCISVVDLFSHHTIEMLAVKIQPVSQVSRTEHVLVEDIDEILSKMQAGKIDILEAQAALDRLQSL